MNPEFTPITNGINQLIDKWEIILTNLPLETISNRRNKQNRTIKEILGHLVDSASNNQQRMVRLQYNQELIFPDYQQDNDRWIAIQDYNNANWHNLVQLWKYFNLHIIQVIEQINNKALENYWNNFEGNKVSLRQMTEGYLAHSNLHMSEIEELIQNGECKNSRI